MEVGDVVVCKKSVKDNPHIIKDKSYIVKEIKDVGLFEVSPILFVILSDDTMINSKFSLSDKESGYYFYDYFYTKRELRTEKLKKVTQK